MSVDIGECPLGGKILLAENHSIISDPFFVFKDHVSNRNFEYIPKVEQDLFLILNRHVGDVGGERREIETDRQIGHSLLLNPLSLTSPSPQRDVSKLQYIYLLIYFLS